MLFYRILSNVRTFEEYSKIYFVYTTYLCSPSATNIKCTYFYSFLRVLSNTFIYLLHQYSLPFQEISYNTFPTPSSPLFYNTKHFRSSLPQSWSLDCLFPLLSATLQHANIFATQYCAYVCTFVCFLWWQIWRNILHTPIHIYTGAWALLIESLSR